jgi:Na+-translocating ferredoxin:NAD+ oxidoreductase RnfG subunit
MPTPAPSPDSPRLRGLALRAFRLGLLVAAVLLLRQQSAGDIALSVERVRDFFPAAAALDAPEAAHGTQAVRDAAGNMLGKVTQTSPDSDSVIGYSGPTNLLIALDPADVVIGLRVLHSADTPDHVAEVIGTRRFFQQFKGLRLGHLEPRTLDGVTGATLTSSAMAEGVLRKLGRQGPSLRFPEAITLEEVKTLEPNASTLRESKRLPGAQDVLDSAGKVIALAARTSPDADTVIGYKGPTDTLMLLDATGTTLRGIRLRKSYDTKTYVAYVTGDDYFLRRFNGLTLQQLATLDFDAAKIEGTSGASETSWSVADGLRRRAQSLLRESSPLLTWVKSIHWRWQDTGHALVLLSALLMAFTRLRGLVWLRTAHHAALVIYVGFIAGELLSQSLFAGWAQHGTPWRSAPGLVLLGVIALLAPVLTRRQLYCHHICPHGALQQLLMKRLPWQFTPPAWMERLPLALLGAVVFIVALGLGFNLNTLEPFDAYVFRIAGLASLVIAIVGLIASLFIPMAYCRYGCPTGALFKVLRYTGDQDRFSKRDWVALGAVVLIGGWRLIGM